MPSGTNLNQGGASGWIIDGATGRGGRKFCHPRHDRASHNDLCVSRFLGGGTLNYFVATVSRNGKLRQ